MKTFKGFTIFRCSPNPSGMRWYARTDRGILKADTLSGLKELIKSTGARA